MNIRYELKDLLLLPLVLLYAVVAGAYAVVRRRKRDEVEYYADE